MFAFGMCGMMRKNTMIVTLCKFLMIFFKGTLHITSNYFNYLLFKNRTEHDNLRIEKPVNI